MKGVGEQKKRVYKYTLNIGKKDFSERRLSCLENMAKMEMYKYTETFESDDTTSLCMSSCGLTRERIVANGPTNMLRF